MDDERNLFIFRDSFEAILEILESYEELEEQFVSAVGKVSVKHFNRSRHHEPEPSGSSKIRKGWLLWSDVINPLRFNHRVHGSFDCFRLFYVQYSHAVKAVYFEGLDRPFDIDSH